jgi:RNA polymerase sigma factor (TIGR02999 family)
VDPQLQARVHRLLQAGPDPAARGELIPLVYEELRAIAQHKMREERGNHTLQTTALVHEAYLRLLGDRNLAWEARTQFYVAASEAMRRVLLDHARRRGARKRGAGRELVDLGSVDLGTDAALDAALDFDAAVEKLSAEEPRAAEVVRLRFYGGLEVDETARVLGLSRRTVLREWAFARARLHQLLAATETA